MAAYVVFAALLLYTHYMGLLLIFELFVAGFIWLARTGKRGETRISTREWVKAHFFLALLYSPWAIAMGIRFAERADELSHLQHRAGFADLYTAFATMSVAPSAIAIWPPAQVALGVTVGGCLMLLAILWPRSPEQKHIVWILAGISLGFVAIIVSISAATGEWLVQPRFVTLVMPPALVVAASVLLFPSVEKRATPIAVMALLLIAAWLFFQTDGIRAFYTNPVHGRDGVREAAAWLNAERKPGDLAVANNGVLPWSLAQYHDGPILGLPDSADVRNGYQLWPTPDLIDLAPAQWDALSSMDANAQRIWLVYLPVMDLHNELMQSIQQHFRLVEHRHYGFADIYLFARQ